MKRVIATGVQDFEKLREGNFFYVDKSAFIREWWKKGDDVTLITRPRRFGKTLNMSMLNCFFSDRYAGRGELFEGLEVWEDEDLRKQQGTWPVIFLSFAKIKPLNFEDALQAINIEIVSIANRYTELLQSDCFTETDRERFFRIRDDMDRATATNALNWICEWLNRASGKKVIFLLDEYDTPLQEAYVNGYWEEMVAYIRAMFNNTFKTNPSLARGIMTGITRVSKESIFSDLNNLTVVTTTSDLYDDSFGFTEPEVFQAMDEQGCEEAEKIAVKTWYDGFTFGKVRDIYNPWSVTNYLNWRKLDTYWANTSGNGLVGSLLREGEPELKQQFEILLAGGCVEAPIDEQIIFNQLEEDRHAVWSLLLASGYLKVEAILQERPEDEAIYRLSLTNLETRKMFSRLISGWFRQDSSFSEFTRSLITGDAESAEEYLADVMETTMSAFDPGRKSADKIAENFYHGLVLGLLVDNAGKYTVKSNRESGFGRYDVVLEPKQDHDPAVILEFKVYRTRNGETTLEDTAANALKQIEEKKYAADLIARGIPEEKILKYGLAFRGKECLIRKG